jgi:hypothetical protein
MTTKKHLLTVAAAAIALSAAPVPARALGLDLGIGSILGNTGLHLGSSYRIGRWSDRFNLGLFLDAGRYINRRKRRARPVEDVQKLRNRSEPNLALRVSPRDAWVYLNGVRVRADGRSSLTLPEGKHRLEFLRDGCRTEVAEVAVQPGIEYRVERKLARLERSEAGDERLATPLPPVSVEEALALGTPKPAISSPGADPAGSTPTADAPAPEGAGR